MGDLDASGTVDAIDVQCSILLSLWNLADMDGVPDCVEVDVGTADTNCSESHEVGDILLVITYALGAPLAPGIDKDADGCYDACQKNDGVCSPFECADYPVDCCKPGIPCSSDPCALSSVCDGTEVCGGLPCPTTDGDACDDSDPCTTATVCSVGVCGGGAPVVCDDGDDCTTDVCDLLRGCVFTPNPACNCPASPAPMTQDCCWPHGYAGCENAGCTACVCDQDPLCCDTLWDANCSKKAHGECFSSCYCGKKQGACCSSHATPGCANLSGCVMCVCSALPLCCSESWSGACVALGMVGALCGGQCGCGEQSPPESMGEPLCAVSGFLGELVDCPLNVVSGAMYYPPAAGIQLNIVYDPSELKLVGLFDDLCFGANNSPPCIPVAVVGQGALPLSTGHTVVSSPSKVEEFAGAVSLVIFNPSKPSTPLTTAYLEPCGIVVGDPSLLNMRFQVLNGLVAESPTKVYGDQASTSDPVPFLLNTAWWSVVTSYVTWPK